MVNKPRLGWIDALRHVLALAVIFQHMTAPNRYPADVNQWIASWVPAIDGAVAGFFWLSGYFSRNGITLAGWRRQTVRLLVPYLLFGTLYGIAMVALHKTTPSDAVRSMATGTGNAPQLYFLPYLWLVSTLVGLVLAKRGKLAAAVVIALLGIAYLVLPTPTSTGPETRLLALYALAYTLGAYRARFAGRGEVIAMVVVAGLIVVGVPWRERYVDLALIALLVEGAIQLSRRVPIDRRLPGSGGVYLLHTPILNYALSILLWKVGVVGIGNVLAALIATYLLALAITITAIRMFSTRRWLLLE